MADRAMAERRKPRRLLLLAALLLSVLLSVGVEARADSGKVTIGSKAFTESRLLAEMMAQLIEARSQLEVERRAGLGGTKICFGALQEGQIDLYPEYTGTGWSVLLSEERRVNDSLEAFLTVQRAFRAKWQLEWLPPFGFSNSYALAMSGPAAERLGVKRISDLLPHAAKLSAGVSHEFLQRDDGYPGLSRAYGLQLGDVKGMEHGLAYEAIRSGKIDLVDSYTTDGKLLRYDIRVLEDDRSFFPPYDAAPLARLEVLQRHPELRQLLGELAFRIDDSRMRTLNHRAEENGGDFASVARAFLREEGLIDVGKSTPTTAAGDNRDAGFFAYLWQHRGYTLARIGEHLLLTAAAVLLAILLAVPLGVLLTRRKLLAAPVLGATGVVQTVPSLALLAFMIPIPGLGLGVRSAIAALFLYALLPIMRNTVTGIQEVDAELVEAARGMGLSGRQILWHVELPLATRTIMAGVRTSTVVSIGVATLAAFIGAGGLGDPILTGLQLDDINLILSGAVPAAVLALLVDTLLGKLEHALVPRGLRSPG